MKVSFQDFRPDVPAKNSYISGVDYIWHDLDLEFEEAFHLIKQLKIHRSCLTVYNSSSCVAFYLFDGGLHVQIDGDGFWVAEDVDLQVAREILKVTYADCDDFGTHVPGTNYEWEAYTSITDTREEMKKMSASIL